MSASKGLILASKLPQLQNLIKRDPKSYEEEFLMQKTHFDSELDILNLHPTQDSSNFTDLVTFMCHVAFCYPEHCEDLPLRLLNLMETKSSVLHQDVRLKLFQGLILLRNRDVIEPVMLMQLCFKLFVVNDKALRVMLGDYIFHDIKSISKKKSSDKLNRSIQALLFTIISNDEPTTVRKTVQLLAQLYRRRIWTDARTVNVIAAACLSANTRVMVAAVNFFLGIEMRMSEDDEEEVSGSKPASVNYHEHSKKTKKRQRLVQKQIEKNAKIVKRNADQENNVAQPLFPAIQMINDPQSLAERLFKKMRQSGQKFEVKLLLMNFISRLIGCHRLLLLSFYTSVQKYLTSHQQNVTLILTYLIQACHELVPPEELMPVVKTIAYNFITERCNNEVLAVGINAVRELFARAPSLLRENDMADFVQDLASYGKKSHKSVMVAAHGVINLVRDLYPALLRKTERGKFHSASNVPLNYGESNVREGVDGADLLEAYESGQIVINNDDEVVWMEDQVDIAAEDDEVSGDDKEVSDDDDDDDDDDEDDDDEKSAAEDDSMEEGDDDDEIDDEEEEDNEIECDVEDSNNDQVDVSAPKMSKASAAKVANSIRHRVDARRVLTDADFELIKKLKGAQADRLRDPKLRNKLTAADFVASDDPRTLNPLKRKHADEADDASTSAEGLSFAVNPQLLAPGLRTGKMDKIARIQNMLQGRTETKFEHEGHRGGLTNKEKLRKKNFVMVRKGKRSIANKPRNANSRSRYSRENKKEIMGRDKRKRRRT